MTLAPERVGPVSGSLQRAGITVTQIGVVTSHEDGFVMITPEGEREMPDFAIDELADSCHPTAMTYRLLALDMDARSSIAIPTPLSPSVPGKQ